MIPPVATDVAGPPVPKPRATGRSSEATGAVALPPRAKPSFSEALRGATTGRDKREERAEAGPEYDASSNERGVLAATVTPAVPLLAPRWNAAAPGELDPPESGPARMLNDRNSALAAADLAAVDIRASRPSRSGGHATAASSHPEISVLALATHAAPAMPQRLAATSAAVELALVTARGTSRVSPTEQLPAESPRVATQRDGHDRGARHADARPPTADPDRPREAPRLPHEPVLGIEPIRGGVGDGVSPGPVAPLSQQVSDAVQQAFAGTSPRGSPDWEQAAASGGRAKGDTLRLLDLSLEPPELGSVRVRLALRDATLRVELEAANPATARILTDEQTQLGARLEAAGYAIEAVAIIPAEATPADANAARGTADAAGALSRQPNFGTPQWGDDGNGGRPASRPRLPHDDSNATTPSHLEPVRGVYV